MRKIQIITDSCSDLTGELLKEYNIDYARMCTVYEGKESPALLTWDNISPSELYGIMRAGNRITTTQVPVEEFNRIFRKYLDMDRDIIYIACSSKQSGSVNTGALAAAKLCEEYEGAKIASIDSRNASLGEGMLAIEAAKMAAAGDNFDTIVEKIKALRNNVREYITVHSLDALRKAGRVKASAAFFGNLMGVKPILVSDADGVQTPIKKVKGRLNSLKETVAQLSESIERPEEQTAYLVHADCSADEVEQLRAMIKEQIPCKDICVCYIGPIIGASIGPDAIGVFAFGKEITYRVGDAK